MVRLLAAGRACRGAPRPCKPGAVLSIQGGSSILGRFVHSLWVNQCLLDPVNVFSCCTGALQMSQSTRASTSQAARPWAMKFRVKTQRTKSIPRLRDTPQDKVPMRSEETGGGDRPSSDEVSSPRSRVGALSKDESFMCGNISELNLFTFVVVSWIFHASNLSHRSKRIEVLSSYYSVGRRIIANANKTLAVEAYKFLHTDTQSSPRMLLKQLL